MSLISSAPFSNVTTYRKDFTKKTPYSSKAAKALPDFPNPIVGPYEEYILPRVKYDALPDTQTKYPNPKEYAEQLAEKYPSTTYLLREPHGGPLNLDVIDKFYEDESRTVYMVSYCTRGDYESIFKKHSIRRPLPEGWEIALTTHKRSYMDPCFLVPNALERSKRVTQKDNLIPNEKEREILQLKTGESIYISDISNTGDEIIKGKLHGDVNVRPQFNQEDLLKAKLIRRE